MIQGDRDVFTVVVVGGAICAVLRFARRFFARLRFRFFFRFFAPLLSDDDPEEDVEEEEDTLPPVITAFARSKVFLSSLTFEFFATMM